MTPAMSRGAAARGSAGATTASENDSQPPDADPFRDVFHMADLRLLLEGCNSWEGIDIILTRADVLDTAGSMAKAVKGEEGCKLLVCIARLRTYQRYLPNVFQEHRLSRMKMTKTDPTVTYGSPLTPKRKTTRIKAKGKVVAQTRKR